MLDNPYIYGIHDRGGEHLLGSKGWVLITTALGTNPNDLSGDDFTDLANDGLAVIVRLNNGYGSAGTLPPEADYDNFAVRVGNYISNTRGAAHFVIGNEINMFRERPNGVTITPRMYATVFEKCRNAIKAFDYRYKVLVAPVGNWNAETPYSADPYGEYGANGIGGAPAEAPYYGYFGDYIKMTRDLIKAIGIGNYDGVAIHAYSHGYNPMLIYDKSKMEAPFETYHYHFKTYEDLLNVLTVDDEVYLTEMNGDTNPDDTKWEQSDGWIQAAYGEIDWSNAQPGRPKIRCGILYRWSNDDDWGFKDKPWVHNDLLKAIDFRYRSDK